MNGLLPDDYYQFHLRGTVIHWGSADAGHYYSYIQDREDLGKWYELNDTRVSNFDIRNLE